jgi:hypothetical protein
MAAQPTEMGDAQEAGYRHGGYMSLGGNNQMSEFNTLDMTNINNTSLREAELDKLRNNSRTSFTNLLNTPANMAANTYLKKPTYTTETVGSGMVNADQQDYARYGGNMFRNGGLNKYGPGGTSIPGYTDEEVAASDDWFAKQVAESAGNEAQSNYYNQISGNTASNNSGTNQGTTNTNTNTTANNSGMTADELAYFRGMMRGSNQGNYAPSWQAQQNQNNGYDAWKAMSRDPEALKKFLSNSGIQDMKWNNKMGIFGPKSKGHITFRTYYDPSTGKTVTAPADQAAASSQSGTTQPGASQQMQKGPKGPGFIQNLIAKNKQRKADKISKKYPLTQQEMEQRPDLNPQAPAPRSNKIFPDPSGFSSYRPTPKPAYGPGFEYGGAPQYNYGGYPQYEEGAELEMDDEAIANYLAMGGTLEYLD